VLHAQFEQVPVGPANHPALRHAEDPHDLVAIEVGPDLRQFLLLTQHGDARLQVVLGPRQSRRLRFVPRGAVRPGQHLQPGQQGAGVPHVPADRRIGPLSLPVPVEPQVQPDQGGHVGDHPGGEAQRFEPGAGHLLAHDLMVVEGHPAVRQQRTGLRLADVVQQRGEPDHQIAVQAVPVLQPDGLLQHGE